MGRISTIDLLVLTSSDALILTLKKYFSYYTKQAILMRRSINEPSPSGSVPWLKA
jgi:hypothetical protein